MMRSIAMQRFYLVVLTAFAAFAVLLAAVGVYASYSYAVASRTSEIGVRLALGAAPRQIMWSVVSRALLHGRSGYRGGPRRGRRRGTTAASVLFGVSAADPFTYFAVGIALIATVLLAALFPALRAARVDPLAAIRR